MRKSARRLDELRERVEELTPREALARMGKGAILIDVREPDEVADGTPKGSRRISRGFLELRIEDVVQDASTELLCLCAGGARSLFAAEDLARMGFENVRSVAGGFSRWKSEGLPVEVPRTLSSDERRRYARHLSMPEIGEAGQEKLLSSRVLLVGAGGLGSPAALYLTAAGVGTLGLVDMDVVERSNLQRQILHTDDRAGERKVMSARRTLTALSPATRIETHDVRLDASNVEDIFEGYDVVVDGCDNFPTRYLVNDACCKLGIPNVHGSIYRFEGQASVFWPGGPDGGPCYRCLFPEPPPAGLAPSCAEAGVLGVLPGVVGTWQAIEAIKLLLGIGEPLVGKLLFYDALSQTTRKLGVRAREDCPVCRPGAEFPGYTSYEEVCGDAVGVGPESC